MNIAVFAGAAEGKKPEYMEAAGVLGKWIGENGHTLVYGDGKVGMMGRVAEATLAAGGKVIGIIPQFMIDAGWENTDVTEMIVTDTMSERKEKMAELADIFVALPGGVGTLEEAADIVSWVRLGLYKAPFIFWNTLGCYDKLKALYDQMIEDEFLNAEELSFVHYLDNIRELEAVIK
ncbi:MAG: TIGR00730 family Rossman fold protein [Eubacterium sp.]|nr:TIGR00730 family Rossman fold protein [Eubacterium sp.]